MNHKIKSFEDACKALKLNPKKCLPNVSFYPKRHQKAITAFHKLVIIAEAINEGWEADWDNSDEYKWYPYFDMRSPSGFSFSCTCNGWTNSSTGVGSRLCFSTSELAEYMGRTFITLYKDLMVLEGGKKKKSKEETQAEKDAEAKKVALSKLTEGEKKLLGL